MKRKSNIGETVRYYFNSRSILHSSYRHGAIHRSTNNYREQFSFVHSEQSSIFTKISRFSKIVGRARQNFANSPGKLFVNLLAPLSSSWTASFVFLSLNLSIHRNLCLTRYVYTSFLLATVVSEVFPLFFDRSRSSVTTSTCSQATAQYFQRWPFQRKTSISTARTGRVHRTQKKRVPAVDLEARDDRELREHSWERARSKLARDVRVEADSFLLRSCKLEALNP